MILLLFEVSQVVQVRAEGPKAPSPGRVGLTCETSVFNKGIIVR